MSFQSFPYFVSNHGNPLIPSKQCGLEKFPCLSLSLALSHMMYSCETRVFRDKRVNIDEGVKLKNILLKRKGKNKLKR
jgi:hypothetical protein